MWTAHKRSWTLDASTTLSRSAVQRASLPVSLAVWKPKVSDSGSFALGRESLKNLPQVLLLWHTEEPPWSLIMHFWNPSVSLHCHQLYISLQCSGSLKLKSKCEGCKRKHGLFTIATSTTEQRRGMFHHDLFFSPAPLVVMASNEASVLRLDML